MDMFNAPTNTATFKVEAHVDDVKPATAFLAEFELVDLSSVFYISHLTTILTEGGGPTINRIDYGYRRQTIRNGHGY